MAKPLHTPHIHKIYYHLVHHSSGSTGFLPEVLTQEKREWMSKGNVLAQIVFLFTSKLQPRNLNQHLMECIEPCLLSQLDKKDHKGLNFIWFLVDLGNRWSVISFSKTKLYCCPLHYLLDKVRPCVWKRIPKSNYILVGDISLKNHSLGFYTDFSQF